MAYNVHGRTVLLSTTREGLISKFKTCQAFCYEYGMLVNQIKTKVMVINGGDADKLRIVSDDVQVDHCKNYVYLGTPISDDGLYATIIDLHIKGKIKHSSVKMGDLAHFFEAPNSAPRTENLTANRKPS